MSFKPKIAMIVARDLNNGIGFRNKLPWSIKEDMTHFRDCTRNTVVVMGRKTFESLEKPLKGRIHVVMTRDDQYKVGPNNYITNNMESVIKIAEHYRKNIFIIGGSEIYELWLEAGYVDEIYLTEVKDTFEVDTYCHINPAWHHTLDDFRIYDGFEILKYIRKT